MKELINNGRKLNCIERRPLNKKLIPEKNAFFRNITECIRYTFDPDIDKSVMMDNFSKGISYKTNRYEYTKIHSAKNKFSIQHKKVIHVRSIDGKIDEIFNTVKEVHEFTNVPLKNIYYCLKSKSNLTGYKWLIKYKNCKPNFNNEEELSNYLQFKKDSRIVVINKKTKTVVVFSGVDDLYNKMNIKIDFSKIKEGNTIFLEDNNLLILKYSFYKSRCKVFFGKYTVSLNIPK